MRRVLPALLVLLLGLLAAPAGADGPSRLEQAYSERAGEPLRLYGHALFAHTAPRAEPALGMVADSHVLGPGDALSVTMRGQTSLHATYLVGSDGLLIVEGLRPIVAAGRSLAALRAELEAEVASALFDTRVFLTLAQPRRLSILVMGEVARPGIHDLSAFATVMDALIAAGGVAAGGSLRAIRVMRPGDPAPGTSVDLYELLREGGGAADARLSEGMRLIVPPLGATIAVAGQVMRPAIYELPPGGAELTADGALALAGGPLRPGRSALRVARVGPDGSERVMELAGGDRVQPGDILLLAPDRSDRRATVALLGHVHSPGPRPLREGQGVAALLADRAARDDSYLPFAVLAGTDPLTGARRLRALDLTADRMAAAPAPADGDALILFGPQEVAFLTSAAVLRLLRHGATGTGEGEGEEPAPAPAPSVCPGIEALALRLAADRDGDLAAGMRAAAAAALTGAELPCPPLFAAQPDLLPFALEHAVLVRTGVLRPGLYPRAPGGDMAALVQAAGGAAGTPAHMAGEIVDAGGGWVELAGAVRDPGRLPLPAEGSLRRLLGADILSDSAYGLFAVVERTDRQRGTRRLIPFSPAEVRQGGTDVALREGDRVLILSRAEARTLADGTGPATTGDDMAGAGEGTADRAALWRLATESTVSIRGAVVEPGSYPIAGTADPAALIEAAGGLLPHADAEGVEVLAGTGAADQGAAGAPRLVRLTGADGVRLAGGDALRVPRRGPPPRRGTVVIAGEVRDPGEYDLMPGETLSSVLARAGGLLPTAYAPGAVFLRESARRVERDQLHRLAAEVEEALAQPPGSDPPPPAKLADARRLLADLRAARPLGRVTVEADPHVLAARPELDIVLEPGDRLHVPRRPLTVAVRGEVLSPASLQFVPGKSARTYLAEAGGLTRQADGGRIFVLLPDGSARPLSTPHRHGVEAVPPGATIIVPRDPDPFDFLKVSQSVTSILAQLALSAAVIVSITD